MAAAGWRAVAPDLRGYGNSERPRGRTASRFEALVADLTLERLAGVSHWVQHEAAAEVNARLLTWLTARGLSTGSAQTGGGFRSVKPA